MIEFIASSLSDAQAIEQGGGNRIELVTALSEGGYTPSIGLVQAIAERVKLPLTVMLRPNRSDFYYTNNELEILRRDAVIFNQLGVKQVVMGILSPDGLPDIRRMEQVLDGTNLRLTFHRAIDYTANILQSVRYLNQYDRVTHILSAGGEGGVPANIDTLKAMIDISHKRIIVGGGLNLTNVQSVMDSLKDLAYDLHFGRAARGGDVRGVVQQDLVKQLMGQVRQK